MSGRHAVSLRDVGVRFYVPRRSRLGRTPRLFRARRWHHWGLRHATVDVEHGEVVGLVGPNGSGKTTMLRVVSGIFRPDEGSIRVAGRVAPILSLTGGLENALSGWENVALSGILLGLSHAETREVGPAVAEFAGIGDEFMDAPVRVYSSGMRARLGFAIAAFSRPDILALDEVLSVGDEEFKERSRQKILEMMRADHTVLIASHDVEEIVAFCDRLVRIEQGEIVEIGPAEGVAERYLADHGRAGRSAHGRR
ncbi:MAG TPA: ABC transporter ATP-binding protein [Actinomycetota bacterium]|nr:ABC transporter ATP-binding protein [Actinomycetota bacterium]